MRNLWIATATLLLTTVSCSEPELGVNDEFYSKNYALSSLNGSGVYGGEGDQYTDFGENPFISAAEDPISTFGIDADGASYANMRGYESDGYRIPAEAVRVEEFINYFNFDYPEPTSENVSINSETAVCPWNNEHYLLRIGLKGKGLNGDRPPANYVFLIDVSGSMSGEDKIEVLKSGFKRLAEQLSDEDHVAIVTYSGNVDVILQSALGSETEKIKNAIDKLTAGGSTAGGAALEMAFEIAEENYIQGGNNRIILGTDGDFNVGVSSTDELIEMIQDFRSLGIFLTICGVGHGNLNESMMEQVANKGDGNYEYIDNGNQIYKVFVQEYDKFFTVAKDAKIQVTFDPFFVDSYRLIGYENRVLADAEFEDDSVDAGEIGASQTLTALYQVIPKNLSSGSFGSLEFRYKKPGEDQSRLLFQSLDNSRSEFPVSTENMRFAASLSGFGMLLKNSDYKGSLSYDQVRQWADEARSFDPYGFREEYVHLIDKVKKLN
ncbi:MAG: von Willebrand factor type A domain-containing protein [Bacteroidales bacterium]|nr:von Willebrand factor type A domain-containing protein [Bacteroidales bacterium]